MVVLTPASQPTLQKDLVSVRDVIKVYREANAETVALRGASLDLKAGEFITLVGKSGSGKSTLLSLIAGLALPTAGQILFEQRDITRLDEAARAALRARRIGLVFQSGNLIPFLTAFENTRLALQLSGQPDSGKRARDLLGEVGLLARLHHLPRQLSGGEAQRVAIAVALAGEPDLLMGDELTGELDSATAEHVIKLISDVWQARHLTVLIVTHNPQLAAVTQRQVKLVDGLVVEA
ncbi:MAG: ABC transporter ATP-binding protein [Candidatus Dormibacteraeota bacterium]|nr:ABC transporter ATP-binding protein [Candidatus Dormibacteraeota bacterium]